MDINFIDELLNGNLALDVEELLCAAEADETFTSDAVIGENALDDFISFIEEETRAKPKACVVESLVETPHVLEEVEVSAASLYSDDIWEKFSLPPESCDIELTDVDLPMDECSPLPLWGTTNVEAAAAAINHDCMWAGSCRSNEHKRSPRRTAAPKPAAAAPEAPRVFPSTTDNSLLLSNRSTTVPAAAGLKKRPVARSLLAKPTNSRSLLLPTIRNNSVLVKSVKIEPADDSDRPHRHSLDSEGNSPRPETPQSMAESEEDDVPVFRHTFDTIFNEGPFVETSCSSTYSNEVVVGDDEDEEPSQLVHASEVTGRRPPTEEECASRTVSSYYNDHSYTMSKGSMRTDNLGVQTPSDSEEEIDVVSVGEKPRAVGLPTNPSPHDRRQLQLTVASAISKGGKVARLPLRMPAARAMPPTPPSSDDADSAAVAPNPKKRACHRGPVKGSKRPRHQYHHRVQHPVGRGRRGGGRFAGSDSEPDSCERRSLHNNMERQRRIDLRNLVEGLRVLVPATEDKKRAAKVVILREAALYCTALRDQGRKLVDTVASLRLEQERLRARVSTLRRSLAANR